MRKISPDAVKGDFDAQLTAIETFYQAGRQAFSSERDQSTFVEHSLLAAAVVWEGFLSDLFIAYVNRDPTRFKQHLKVSFDEHLKTGKKPQRVFKSFGTLRLPDHLSKAQVVELADGDGNNITFSNYRDIEEKADTWLAREHANGIKTRSAQEKATIDAVVALRNHIAHRSQRSLDVMNETLSRGALHPTGLQRGQYRFHNVGTYLKAKPTGRQATRFSLILSTLREIGAAL
jgi:hypothetical protein